MMQRVCEEWRRKEKEGVGYFIGNSRVPPYYVMPIPIVLMFALSLFFVLYLSLFSLFFGEDTRCWFGYRGYTLWSSECDDARSLLFGHRMHGGTGCVATTSGIPGEGALFYYISSPFIPFFSFFLCLFYRVLLFIEVFFSEWMDVLYGMGVFGVDEGPPSNTHPLPSIFPVLLWDYQFCILFCWFSANHSFSPHPVEYCCVCFCRCKCWFGTHVDLCCVCF